METENTTNEIAKNTTKQAGPVAVSDSDETATSPSTSATDGTTSEMPEMPGDMGQGGPMGSGFSGGATTMAATETNEWLVPMTATGIIAGTIVAATVAICLMIWFTGKKKLVD
ncbi:hypothetical protein IJG90_04205 [Candidatus Saccharibacteria bacterium]|nr:hypothetical protein [Candidatus Saccharibacteria bacterium]